MFLPGIPEALSQVWQHLLVRICWSQVKRAFSWTFLMPSSLLPISNQQQGMSPSFPGPFCALSKIYFCFLLKFGNSLGQYDASASTSPHQIPGMSSGFHLAESALWQSIFRHQPSFLMSFSRDRPTHTRTLTHSQSASDPTQHVFDL